MSGTDPRLLQVLDEPVATALRSAAGDTPCHLVGGLLRDRLLGLPGSDYDAVVAAGGRRIGERLARALPARLVHLGGKAFAAYRLAGEGFTLDIWDRQGQELDSDLARRDFTVNAFALDVADARVADPFDGLGDLGRRRLRATTPGVFADDPLRVLRLVRLCLQLPGFAADPETRALARAASAGLAVVAAERVREELGKVLRAPAARAGLELLAELNLYPGLLRGRPGEPGDSRRAAELLRRLEPAIERLSAHPQPHGTLEPSAARLAALFAGLGPERSAAEAALASFHRAGYVDGRLASRSRRLLRWREVPETPAAARWLLHSGGEEWPADVAVLAALAEPPLDWRGWCRLQERLTALAGREAAAIFAPEPLLDGEEIGRLLGLPPGPEIGAAVERLRRAQVEGRVSDRAGAERLLRRPASGAG